MIYRASEDELAEHICQLNQFHPTIKFTSEMSRCSIDFLDVTVFRKPDNSIGTKLFVKPTNTGQYLNAHSFHQIESIAYSQALRMRLICSEKEDFEKSTNILLKNLTLCGHPHNKSKLAIFKARDIPRSQLLSPTTNKTKPKIIPFILTYTPHNRRIPHILKSATSFLRPSPANRKFQEYRMMIACPHSLNLKDMLVHSELPPPIRKPMSRPCMRFSCNICEHMITTTHINCVTHDSPQRFPIIGLNTCDPTV